MKDEVERLRRRIQILKGEIIIIRMKGVNNTQEIEKRERIITGIKSKIEQLEKKVEKKEN